MNKTTRELKFRVWLHNDKRWGEVAVLEVFNSSGKLEYLYQNQDYTIQQYTGLKDKNGKEIYEGDIIETHPFLLYPSIAENYIVIFCDGKFCLSQNKKPEDTLELVHHSDTHILEVIGNIFENPELLKQKDDERT